MLRWFSVAALLAGSLLIAACGDSESSDEPKAATTASSGKPDPEQVQVGALLAQIRGHNAVALERHEAGDHAAADKHAKHPGREVLDSVLPEIEEISPQAARTLKALVSRNAQAAGEDGSADLRTGAARVAQATRRAEEAVAGDAVDTSAYRGSVVAALLASAAHEYDEAISGSSVERLDEYQDAFGFLSEARRMYGEISDDVKAASAAGAEEIDQAFAELGSALPSGAEPTSPVPVGDVEQAATLIGAELSETVGALAAEAAEPAQVARRIKDLLAQVVREYEPGQPDGAAELSAEAYIENYELIEPEVIEKAPDVNAALEPLLGAELRKRIREGAPAAEIRSMTREARELLDQALARLEPGS